MRSCSPARPPWLHDEGDAQEQETAAQEYGRNEAVFQVTEPVANHADEPEKRDPGVRYQEECQGHCACIGLQPGAVSRQVVWDERRMSTMLAP